MSLLKVRPLSKSRIPVDMASEKNPFGTIPLSMRSAMNLYSSTNLLLSLLEFNSALGWPRFHYSLSNVGNDVCISRASLQLLTSLSLLPILFLPTSGFDAIKRRAPVLVTFLITLALLIDGALRLIPFLQALFYGHVLAIFNLNPLLVVSHLLVHSAWLLQTRERPAEKNKVREARVFAESLVSPTDLTLDAAISALRAYALTMISIYFTKIALNVIRVSTAIVLLAIVVTVACLRMAWTILRESIYILIQTAPYESIQSIRSRRDQLLALEGVVDCVNVHVWEESQGLVVGSLHVHVDPTSCKYTVLRRAISVFDGLVDDLTIQVECYPPRS